MTSSFNASNSIVFKNGIKNADFVVYNPLNIEFTDEELVLTDIELADTPFWQNIKSLTWSSSCRFFYVVSDTNIVMGNTHDNKAVATNNHSRYIFDEFLKAFKSRRK